MGTAGSSWPTARRLSGAGRGGFTLIELLVAVGLLVLILMSVAYVFSTTTQAIGRTQGNNELMANLLPFCETLREDLTGLEHDGFLIIGRRQQDAWGSLRDRSDEYKQTFRNDWMLLTTCTEQYSAVDNRAIGQWARVLYGQGQVTDPADSDYSPLGTDWVLMRHQVLMLSKLPIDLWEIEATNQGPYSGKGVYEGLEWPASGDYIGHGKPYRRGAMSHVKRDLRWYWFMNYGWKGDLSTPDYDFTSSGGSLVPGLAYKEPAYYHTASFYNSDALKRFHALPHCAEFRIQYAMAEDLKAGPGGTVQWRDPPAVGASGNSQDPNYRANDPLHTSQTIQDGRLAFGPGDRWPALLRVTVHIFDPFDRVEGGRKMSVVVSVP